MCLLPVLLPPPHFLDPWLHVSLGVLGGILGYKLARIYDDTTYALSRQYAAYSSLPTWAHAQMNDDELAAELRSKRLFEFDEKFSALAAIEEKEFIQLRSTMSQADGQKGAGRVSQALA